MSVNMTKKLESLCIFVFVFVNNLKVFHFNMVKMTVALSTPISVDSLKGAARNENFKDSSLQNESLFYL